MSTRKVYTTFVLLLLAASTTSSAIPIWELLSYEEKMGRLLYVFVHLVERYCKTTPMADCRKVMTLYGTSNLLNHDDHSLDLLDPDQRNASQLIWQAATKSQYKYPMEKNGDQEIKFTGLPSTVQATKQIAPRVILPPPKFLWRNFWKL